MLVSALTGFSLFMIGCSLAPSFTFFAVMRLLACLGVGGLLPTVVAVVNEFAAVGRKSAIMGAVLTGPAIGTVLASTSALTLLPGHGVRPVYALGGLPLLLVPFAWRLLPESPAFLRARGRDAEGAAISAAYGLPVPEHPRRFGSATPEAAQRLFGGRLLLPTLGIWAICLISLLTIFGLTTWLPQIMRDSGYGTSASIAFLLVYSAGAIVGTLVASQLSQRTSPRTMVTTGFVAAALALAVMAAQPRGALLLAAVFVAGFGGLGTQNMINDHVAQFYPTPLRATGLGWALAVGRIGAIVGPTYGVMAIGSTGGVRAAAMAFGIPAALGAVISHFLPSSAGKAPTSEEFTTNPEAVPQP